MKKYLSTILLTRSIGIVLLISGFGIITTTDISAQTAASFQGAHNVPSGNFVDVPTAIVRIEQHLEYLKIFMSQLNPNSQDYKNLQESYTYFELIGSILAEAESTHSNLVAQAIATALELLSMDAYGAVSTKKHGELKQSAITLLRL